MSQSELFCVTRMAVPEAQHAGRPVYKHMLGWPARGAGGGSRGAVRWQATPRPPVPTCPMPRRTPVLRPQRMEFAAFNHRGTGLLGSLPHLRQLDVKMPQLG